MRFGGQMAIGFVILALPLLFSLVWVPSNV